MISSKYRFHSRGGVQAVRARGKKIYGREITAVAMENARGGTRIGVVVSKKVLKSAVARNRLRRRVYEVVRQELPFPRPMDVLLLVQSAEVKDMEYDILRDLLRQILRDSFDVI
ncbi:ribonuclease P protein component [Candidatus Saccharibacteria bacterium]|nr:ribonuclease P protein component [Candidatus Saccharibacteria bacterium]